MVYGVNIETRLPSYLEIVPDKPVERFLRMFILSSKMVEELVIISPIIGMLRGGVSVSMNRVIERINRERIKTYVITNEPSHYHPSHVQAMTALKQSNFIEIRYNESLHAKVYICRTRDGGFALLGSGNLTETSIQRRIEIGMVIFRRGDGIPLFQELSKWGLERLRSVRGSILIKRMTPRR